MLFVAVDDRLGVALGSKAMGPGQPLAQLSEVVDLAVQQDLEGPVLVGERLVGDVREVDDRQSPVREAHRRKSIAVLEHALGVGTTVRQRRRHGAQRRRDGGALAKLQDSGDAAHLLAGLAPPGIHG